MLPTKVYFISGVGTHKQNKNARDKASEQCGISDINIHGGVSSVLTPGIRVIDKEEFRSIVRPGEIVDMIEGVNESNVIGQIVSASLVAVLPESPDVTGYISELYEHSGISLRTSIRRSETMALQIFAERNGDMDFVADLVWRPLVRDYTVAGKRIRLRTVHAHGEVNWSGDYTCALVGAILLP
jgi:arginine decarboxylase